MPTIQLSWPNRKAAIRAAVLSGRWADRDPQRGVRAVFAYRGIASSKATGTRCDGSPSYVARAITDRLPRRCRHLDGLRVLAVGAPIRRDAS